MKDGLFELLMSFFEQTLTQIKEANPEKEASVLSSHSQTNSSTILTTGSDRVLLTTPAVQSPTTRKKTSMRVFTAAEQFKFTKSSYQFIIRLMRLELIAMDTMEEIINQLLFSESAFVTLQETKWAIRNTLAERLDLKQLAFLDLILYQKEDKLALH